MHYITTQLQDEMFQQGDMYKEKMSQQAAEDWIHSHELIAIDWYDNNNIYNALSRRFGVVIRGSSLGHRILEKNDTVLVFRNNLHLLDRSEIYSEDDIENATFSFSLWTVL